MVRGVIVVLITMFVVVIGLLVGSAALEPLADSTKDFDSIDQGPLNGSSVIDDVLDTALQYMPLIVIGGIILWAFRWYMRQERFVGGRRR